MAVLYPALFPNFTAEDTEDAEIDLTPLRPPCPAVIKELSSYNPSLREEGEHKD